MYLSLLLHSLIVVSCLLRVKLSMTRILRSYRKVGHLCLSEMCWLSGCSLPVFNAYLILHRVFPWEVVLHPA